jgi:hypothetical protein
VLQNSIKGHVAGSKSPNLNLPYMYRQNSFP